MISGSELPACLLGIIAHAESAWDLHGYASVLAALDAMEQPHGNRPLGRLRMFGICCVGGHVR